MDQFFDQLVGVYAGKDSDFECTVQLKAGELTVNNFWMPPSRFMPLVPQTANRFSVRGVPTELIFEWLEAEQTWQMQIAGSQGEHVGKILLKHT